MKELTIEEKAIAYDEAIKRARQLLIDGCSNYDKETIWNIFPGLVESEEERIRKRLIGVVELYYGNTDEQEKKDCLAWLEKQGKNKPQGKSALEAIKEEKVDNANKAEPKFHEGDWVVTDKGDTIQIAAVNSGYYTVNNGMDFSTSYVDKLTQLCRPERNG